MNNQTIFIGYNVSGDPLWSVQTPKWMRRKRGRFIRREGLKITRTTETIVGIIGEPCTYREALHALRIGDVCQVIEVTFEQTASPANIYFADIYLDGERVGFMWKQYTGSNYKACLATRFAREGDAYIDFGANLARAHSLIRREINLQII